MIVFSLVPVSAVAGYIDIGKYFSRDDSRDNKRIKDCFPTSTVEIGE